MGSLVVEVLFDVMDVLLALLEEERSKAEVASPLYSLACMTRSAMDGWVTWIQSPLDNAFVILAEQITVRTCLEFF